jgi:hypothetical protein
MLGATGDDGAEGAHDVEGARLLPFPLAVARLDHCRGDDLVLILR